MNKKIFNLNFGFNRHIPLILQGESAECGLACVGMIAGYYGHEIDLLNLRARFSISSRGVTLKNLIEISNALKLSCRAIKLDENTIKYIQLPCVLHWNFNHFVVLKKIKYKANGEIKSYLINDPARGELTVLPAEFSASFTGAVLELTPAPEFKKKKEKQQLNLVTLIVGAIGLRRGVLQIFLLALSLEIFTLLSPFFMQLVVDGVIFSSDREMLLALVMGFGLLMLIQQAIAAFRSWSLLYLSTHLNLQWVTNVFAHLLNLPMSYFEKRHIGDILSRFGAVTNIEQALSTKLVETLLDGIFAVSILAMLLFYSVSLCLIALSFIAIYLILRWAAYSSFKQASEQYLYSQAKESSIFMESISGVQAIKLFNHENVRCNRWTNAVVTTVNQKLTTKKMQLGFATLENVLKGLDNLVIVWIGALLVMDKTFSLGMLFAFITYKTMLVGRMYSLSESLIELRMLSLQSERLADIVLSKREDTPSGIENQIESIRQPQDLNYTGCKTSTTNNTIEFKDVSFRYSDIEPWVIKNLTLTIKPGESIAIVGASGCGKTTILKLLIGMLIPTNGAINVGGVPLSQTGYRQFRNLIGAVMQNDHLFTGSIADNISFFDENIDIEWMNECAKVAAISPDITAMPMGYQTLISGMNSTLSGGQIQRLLLARALYKRPQILLLDEATSHLDITNEFNVNESIKSLLLTKIIVAHRTETISSADRIITISNGNVVSDISNK